MMAGMALAIFTYRPIFNTFLNDTKVLIDPLRQPNPKADVVKKTVIANKDTVVASTQHDFFRFGVEFDIQKNDTLRFDKSTREDYTTSIAINKKLGTGLYFKFIALVFILILYVTMVYGPIAAFLVEMFPTKIRYTSMSLPYHIGNGVFGGLVPFIGLLLTTTYTDDPLVGLWYPIAVAALCLVIGTLYLRNKIDRNIND